MQMVRSKYWYRYVCISNCIKIYRKTLIVIWYNTLFTRFSRKVLLDFLSRWFLFLSYKYNLSCLLGERNEYQFELLLPPTPTPTPREKGNELFLVFCRIIFDAFDGYQNRIGVGCLCWNCFFSCQSGLGFNDKEKMCQKRHVLGFVNRNIDISV